MHTTDNIGLQDCTPDGLIEGSNDPTLYYILGGFLKKNVFVFFY